MKTIKTARLVMPAIRLPDDDLDMHLEFARRGVGGFCVFGGDRATLPGIVARLREAAPHPLLFAGDFEDGVGQQVAGMTRHPPAAALDADAAELSGIRTAVEARGLGFTMVFAPVADVCSNLANPIINARAFPDAAACAAAYVRGARRLGLRTCAKHFPGHGATGEDSHDTLPVVDASDETWRTRDLPPFAACIEAGVDAVMTAHVACPALTGSPTLPATLSRAVMTDLLRGDLGFSGLLLTDALLMAGVLVGRTEPEAAIASLEAGCDVLLCPDDVEGVLAAVTEVPEKDLEASLERMAASAEALPDPLANAAERSLRTDGDVFVGDGPHPLRVFDPFGGGEELAAAGGWAWERLGGRGGGPGRGLAKRVFAVLRPDRAWGGELGLPDEVCKAMREAEVLVVLGPKSLIPAHGPALRVHGPGQDLETLAAVARELHGGTRFSLKWSGQCS